MPCPPSGVASTLPPTYYTSDVEAAPCPPSGGEDTLSSTHSSVEAVPVPPGGEVGTLPTTLNSHLNQLFSEHWIWVSHPPARGSFSLLQILSLFGRPIRLCVALRASSAEVSAGGECRPGIFVEMSSHHSAERLVSYKHKRFLFGQCSPVMVEHSYPPPGLVSTPFSVSKVVVSSPTLTATLSGGAVLDSDNVADLFSHFDHGVTVRAQDLSFTVNFSSIGRAAQYFESEVVPQGDHLFRRMEGLTVIDLSFEGGAVPSTLPLVDTESISSYSVDEAVPCSPSGAVMRSRSVTSSGSVVAHPPSGEAITPPPSPLRSNVLKGVSSPPASVEAVPGNPSGESDALPPTCSSKQRRINPSHQG